MSSEPGDKEESSDNLAFPGESVEPGNDSEEERFVNNTLNMNLENKNNRIKNSVNEPGAAEDEVKETNNNRGPKFSESIMQFAKKLLGYARALIMALKENPVAMSVGIMTLVAYLVITQGGLSPVVSPKPYVAPPQLEPTCDVEFTKLAFLAAKQIPGTRCQRLDPPEGADPDVCKKKVLEQVLNAGPSAIEMADAEAEKNSSEAAYLEVQIDSRSSPADRDRAEKAVLAARKRHREMVQERQAALWRQGLSWTGKAFVHCET